jgi:tRNA(fMet)-specific endonuclease VapC
MFCLDTNVVIGVMNGRAPRVQARLAAELIARTPLLIPAIVRFELWHGARKSARPERNLARIDEFFSAIPDVLAFDAADAEEAGDIRAHLEKSGTPIGAYDVLIAAQARRRGAALVTGNLREFQRVPRLTVADWNA